MNSGQVTFFSTFRGSFDSPMPVDRRDDQRPSAMRQGRPLAGGISWLGRPRAVLALLATIVGAAGAAAEALIVADKTFLLGFDRNSGAVVGLQHPADSTLNFVISPTQQPAMAVSDSRWLGDFVLRYRLGNMPWRQATTGRSGDRRRIERLAAGLDVRYSGNSRDPAGFHGLDVHESYRLTGQALVWSITLQNRTADGLEIGDLALPMPFNTIYSKDLRVTYEERLVRHSHVAGDNSFIILTRANGAGPFLLITPQAGTRLEYFDRPVKGGRANADPSIFGPFHDREASWEGLYTAYVHASIQAREIEPRGSWPQPVTSRNLAPQGHPGDAATYRFSFRWVDDYAAARRALVDEGLLDIETAPGMVIPQDLPAMVSIAAREPIESVTAQYPDETRIELVPSPHPKRRNWRFRFGRLGENMIRVRWGNGRETQLAYFVTEPLETLVKKRAAFLVNRQQVRDPDKWYDGLFSVWDMKEAKLRTPDDAGGLHPYMVSGSDDLSLSKAPYVAAKNLAYPKAEEISAIEYYLERFVWGKLQRTDREQPFPYGIYGSNSWKANRFSSIGYGSGGRGRERLWRTFDYTHLIQLYFQMYRIARAYPEHVRYLAAEQYLERAYGTAMAFFEVPYQIKMGPPFHFRGWADWAYKQGAFHELHIPGLIDALDREGRGADAARLRAEWEKKAKYFAYDDPYPFGSEMFFDTTAFQSAHALARYGIANDLKPDQGLWRDKNSGVVNSHPRVERADFRRLMERSIQANIAARGWLESSWYQLGSDYRQRGNSTYLLSYMTQMGGAPILDYALNYAQGDASALMRLGYASYLGSWALVNSGPAKTGHGYWFKGAENDGAAAWAFQPAKYGSLFDGLAFHQGRGAWRHDGEIDNGFSDALLEAATVVTDDPLFGRIALGGDLAETAAALAVTPRDGVRQRLRVRVNGLRVDLTLDHDGFAANSPIILSKSNDRLSFQLEKRYGKPHWTVATVQGLARGTYRLTFDGKDRLLKIAQAPVDIALVVGTRDSYSVKLERLTRSSGRDTTRAPPLSACGRAPGSIAHAKSRSNRSNSSAARVDRRNGLYRLLPAVHHVVAGIGRSSRPAMGHVLKGSYTR